jgi:hypothetical protein
MAPAVTSRLACLLCGAAILLLTVPTASAAGKPRLLLPVHKLLL